MLGSLESSSSRRRPAEDHPDEPAATRQRRLNSFFQGLHLSLDCFGADASGNRSLNFHRMVNCKGFHDPQEDKSLRSHCGLHESTVAAILRHQQWQDTLSHVIDFLKRPGNRSGRISMGVYCARGRHRSVAVCFLLSEALQRLGAQVHVSFTERQAGNWNRLCSTCRKCRSTPAKTANVDTVTEQILAMLD